jgi:hypothetical protein
MMKDSVLKTTNTYFHKSTKQFITLRLGVTIVFYYSQTFIAITMHVRTIVFKHTFKKPNKT